ncbi:hypothetical protein BDK51DRAFT_36821 [Blyttiomyces helicus]|uniref:Uncharacterized protein n=1 Tax=Blyttiomyces helicus TaxID=388810 RepID=A0A4P9WFN9_9FUNG|nr:hypothetical protein BDK51DRAFT_36821 [Blyttiomyces helicus]|eukprot:RKO91222.1 hypothetical protein BDK51DRAFT_36821 [Blyttiomyces helicus]
MQPVATHSAMPLSSSARPLLVQDVGLAFEELGTGLAYSGAPAQTLSPRTLVRNEPPIEHMDVSRQWHTVTPPLMPASDIVPLQGSDPLWRTPPTVSPSPELLPPSFLGSGNPNPAPVPGLQHYSDGLPVGRATFSAQSPPFPVRPQATADVVQRAGQTPVWSNVEAVVSHSPLELFQPLPVPSNGFSPARELLPPSSISLNRFAAPPEFFPQSPIQSRRFSPSPSPPPSSNFPSSPKQFPQPPTVSSSKFVTSSDILPPSPSPTASPELKPSTGLQPTPLPPTKPAPQRRKLKGTITRQENATCNSCGVDEVVLLLHGPESSLTGERRMTYTCASCDTTARMASASLAEPVAEPAPKSAGKRKKGPVKNRSDVLCSACARCVGVGQMHVRADGAPRDGERPREEWVEPVFNVEVCGGGGVFRTGRWRPRELFRAGKRNCSLSHERLGADTYVYETRRCPDAVTPTDLSVVRTLWVQGTLRGRACAKAMEASVEFRTYESVVARCEKGESEVMDFLAAESRPGVERIIVFQWDAGRAKNRKTAPTEPTTAPTGPRRLHGFMTAQVNHDKRVIFLSYSFSLNPSRLVMSGLFRAVVSAAIAAHTYKHPELPPVEHVCAPLWPVPPDAPSNMQHSHPNNWGGAGFVLVEKTGEGGGVDFDEPGVFPEDVRHRLENYVVEVEALLKWCGDVDNYS